MEQRIEQRDLKCALALRDMETFQQRAEGGESPTLNQYLKDYNTIFDKAKEACGQSTKDHFDLHQRAQNGLRARNAYVGSSYVS